MTTGQSSAISTLSMYLRMLLTHGARSVLRAAKVAQGACKEIQGVRRWALNVQGRSNHNKATCALANKLARICYARLTQLTDVRRDAVAQPDVGLNGSTSVL